MEIGYSGVEGGPSDNVYAAYRSFRKQFLDHCLDVAPDEGLREFYKSATVVLTESEFEEYFKGLSMAQKEHLTSVWKRGVEAWIKGAKRADARFLRRVNEWGCPPEFEERAQEALKRIRTSKARG